MAGIDRNRQEQTGTDRNRQEQAGTDRNRQGQTRSSRSRQKEAGIGILSKLGRDKHRQSHCCHGQRQPKVCRVRCQVFTYSLLLRVCSVHQQCAV